MASLYVIRHGQTDWNKIKRIQGSTDTSLNEEGRRMAMAARDRYADVHFDMCFCSPMKRARQTADILLSGRDIPIEYDDRLRELSFGEYEGEEYPLLPEEHPLRTAFKDPANYVAPGDAESLTELIARTAQFLDEKVYPLLDKDLDVLIVGHGAMNSSIIYNIRKHPIEKFWEEGIENCELKRLI